MLTIEDLIASARPNTTNVDRQTFTELISKGQGILIDIREPNEFSVGTIEGARNIPRGVLESQILLQPEIKTASTPECLPLLIFCRSGARGVLAADTLQTMGFKNVVNLAGGILDWQK
ncbi:hypothetical protein C2869_09795 [Saccharobesus litoralis]|uniref:Rhodanese domain-containing protein n=1 Tax=Saccharobesus litoralis TaxID=2172099 RepID=A0A2S0VR57_9ALTE|nr:rhodanese-like domain-containing protein [Saccharobesus litoralis]AWB66705.1 hypothetical protein C2869_09795 [Saccharobesus litoralis]